MSHFPAKLGSMACSTTQQRITRGEASSPARGRVGPRTNARVTDAHTGASALPARPSIYDSLLSAARMSDVPSLFAQSSHVWQSSYRHVPNTMHSDSSVSQVRARTSAPPTPLVVRDKNYEACLVSVFTLTPADTSRTYNKEKYRDPSSSSSSSTSESHAAKCNKTVDKKKKRSARVDRSYRSEASRREESRRSNQSSVSGRRSRTRSRYTVSAHDTQKGSHSGRETSHRDAHPVSSGTTKSSSSAHTRSAHSDTHRSSSSGMKKAQQEQRQHHRQGDTKCSKDSRRNDITHTSSDNSTSSSNSTFHIHQSNSDSCSSGRGGSSKSKGKGKGKNRDVRAANPRGKIILVVKHTDDSDDVEDTLRHQFMIMCRCYWANFKEIPMPINPEAHDSKCPCAAEQAAYEKVMSMMESDYVTPALLTGGVTENNNNNMEHASSMMCARDHHYSARRVRHRGHGNFSHCCACCCRYCMSITVSSSSSSSSRSDTSDGRQCHECNKADRCGICAAGTTSPPRCSHLLCGAHRRDRHGHSSPHHRHDCHDCHHHRHHTPRHCHSCSHTRGDASVAHRTSLDSVFDTSSLSASTRACHRDDVTDAAQHQEQQQQQPDRDVKDCETVVHTPSDTTTHTQAP